MESPGAAPEGLAKFPAAEHGRAREPSWIDLCPACACRGPAGTAGLHARAGGGRVDRHPHLFGTRWRAGAGDADRSAHRRAHHGRGRGGSVGRRQALRLCRRRRGRPPFACGSERDHRATRTFRTRGTGCAGAALIHRPAATHGAALRLTRSRARCGRMTVSPVRTNIMNIRIPGGALALLAPLAAHPALAQDETDPATGPANEITVESQLMHPSAGLMNDHMHEGGEAMIGLRFERHRYSGANRSGTDELSDAEVLAAGYTVRALSMEMDMLMLDLMYAPTDNITLMVMPHYMWHRMEMVG